MVHIKLNTTKLKETFFPNHNLFFIQNKIIKIKKTTTDDEQGIGILRELCRYATVVCGPMYYLCCGP